MKSRRMECCSSLIWNTLSAAFQLEVTVGQKAEDWTKWGSLRRLNNGPKTKGSETFSHITKNWQTPWEQINRLINRSPKSQFTSRPYFKNKGAKCKAKVPKLFWRDDLLYCTSKCLRRTEPLSFYLFLLSYRLTWIGSSGSSSINWGRRRLYFWKICIRLIALLNLILWYGFWSCEACS